jgi:glucosamine-6-phosphate deaminase
VAEPHLVVVDDAAALARAGADMVANAVHADGPVTVVPATGETPVAMYAELVARRARGDLDTGGVSIVQLDEYLGLEREDRRTLFGWMDRTVLEPLEIGADRVTRLPTEGDVDAACAVFDRALDTRGGIDLAILGLGTNGHLGFNEPPSGADAPTRSVPLSAASLASNARYWAGLPVPTRALTAGMTTILAVRRVILVVSGERKRSILRELLTGPVSPALPASYLRTHPAAMLLVDAPAWPPDLPIPAATDASGVSVGT